MQSTVLQTINVLFQSRLDNSCLCSTPCHPTNSWSKTLAVASGKSHIYWDVFISSGPKLSWDCGWSEPLGKAMSVISDQWRLSGREHKKQSVVGKEINTVNKWERLPPLFVTAHSSLGSHGPGAPPGWWPLNPSGWRVHFKHLVTPNSDWALFILLHKIYIF